MQYHLIFFPWIGAVIGIILLGWRLVATFFGVGEIAYILIGTAIPLIITGGFHVDGYMDTMDAFRSYQSKEEKLQILKDPHIGAFAAIMLGLLGLVYIAAFSEINEEMLWIFAAGFFLARTLSGIAVISFPSAKKEGMLHTFSSTAQGYGRNKVKLLLYAQFVICSCYMIWKQPFAGSVLVITSVLVFLYYWYRTKKELGGITGDTAGYFVTVAETAMAVVAAICSLVL